MIKVLFLTILWSLFPKISAETTFSWLKSCLIFFISDEVPNNPPFDDNDSTETENVSKSNISSTESTISVSTSALIRNAEGSNFDSKVDINTTTTTDDTK